MTPRADPPAEIVSRLGTLCLALPEAYEEDAWSGVRWRVGGRTFAHVVQIEDGHPPAYARAAATNGPACTLTFRSSGAELAALRDHDHPYFAPPWHPSVVGLVVGAETDWAEVAELVRESYALLAPKRLRDRFERPAD